MWTAFHQWWIGAPAAAGAPARARAGPVGAAPSPAAPPPADLGSRFTAALFGVAAPGADAPSATEQAWLRRLAEATRAGAAEPLVPRMPSALPRLMGLLRRGDSDVRELTDLLGREPALLGEVMRLAGAAGRQARPVASLHAAVALLGQRGLEQVVGRAVMAPVFALARGRFGAAAGPRLWEHAQRTAHACAFLRQGAIDAFEAYLAGIVARTGLIVALRLIDQSGLREAPASLVFHRRLGGLSQRLSARIARHWNLPEDAAQSVARLARSAPDDGELTHALRRADRCSMAHLLAVPREAMGAADRACLTELDRAFGPSTARAR